MRPSALRRQLGEALLTFAWSEWSQMGVPGGAAATSPWAQDPEALVVFTLEVARDDPRLFDELLTWLAANEQLVSARRLRAMCIDDEDRPLVEATIGWVARVTSRSRKRSVRPAAEAEGLEPLFRGLSVPSGDLDPAFEKAGLARPRAMPGPGWSPDLRLPINLAFRLRLMLGVSARAEVMRHLLTVPPRTFVTTQRLASSAGFARRNVHEALGALRGAGVVEVRTSAGAMHWGADRDRWAALWGLDAARLPEHRPWPALLGGLRTVLRWLSVPGAEELSDYILASQARDLLEHVRPGFEVAGISIGSRAVAETWDDLERLVEDATELLSPQTTDRVG
jgi:hypothetical protein